MNFKSGWFIVMVIPFFFKNEAATSVESIKRVMSPGWPVYSNIISRMLSFRRLDRILKNIVSAYFLTFIVLNVFTNKFSLAEKKPVAGKQKFS